MSGESVPPSSTLPDGTGAVGYAKAPFDDPRGDIILQTSDHINYRVLKFILELSSPVFRDMLSVPQPPITNDGPTELPIVHVSEPSSTLSTILEFCYPVKRPQLMSCSMSKIGDVLRAALKYDISVASDPAREALEKRAEMSEQNALAAYAIACDLKLKKETRVAATACLVWPSLGTPVPEMALMSGLDHYNLLDFHRRAGKAVVSLFENPSSVHLWIPQFGNKCCFALPKEGLARMKAINWLQGSMSTLKDALSVAPFHVGNFSSSTFISEMDRRVSCPERKQKLVRGWEGIRQKIFDSVDGEVTKVELKFSWE